MTPVHPAELHPYLDQRHTTDDSTSAIVQAFEVVEEPGKETRCNPARPGDVRRGM
jgi:hypothetical protein